MSATPPATSPQKWAFWHKLAFGAYLLPLVIALLWAIWWMAPLLLPLHWALVQRIGLRLGLAVQAALWALLVLLWRQVPAMPGLVQGTVCMVGWLYLGCGILGWLAFAIGAICGTLGF